MNGECNIMNNKIVAIVGMCGSGKSVLTNYFVLDDFKQVYFGNFTMLEMHKRNLQINPTNEKKIREELRVKYGPAAYAILACDFIENYIRTNNVVLDGLYSWSEFKYLKEKYGDNLTILAIVTNNSVRKERLKNRKIRPLNANEVDKRDYAEIENIEKGGPIAIADYYIINNCDTDSLKKQYMEFIKWLNQ